MKQTTEDAQISNTKWKGKNKTEHTQNTKTDMCSQFHTKFAFSDGRMDSALLLRQSLLRLLVVHTIWQCLVLLLSSVCWVFFFLLYIRCYYYCEFCAKSGRRYILRNKPIYHLLYAFHLVFLLLHFVYVTILIILYIFVNFFFSLVFSSDYLPYK